LNRSNRIIFPTLASSATAFGATATPLQMLLLYIYRRRFSLAKYHSRVILFFLSVLHIQGLDNRQ
jgi:hypothetical protein